MYSDNKRKSWYCCKDCILIWLLQFHYYWSLSLAERKKLDALKKDIFFGNFVAGFFYLFGTQKILGFLTVSILNKHKWGFDSVIIMILLYNFIYMYHYNYSMLAPYKKIIRVKQLQKVHEGQKPGVQFKVKKNFMSKMFGACCRGIG